MTAPATSLSLEPQLPAAPTRLLVKKHRAAEILDVSAPTIDRWIRAGHLEKVKFGPRAVRITMSSIERMVDAPPASPKKAVQA